MKHIVAKKRQESRARAKVESANASRNHSVRASVAAPEPRIFKPPSSDSITGSYFSTTNIERPSVSDAPDAQTTSAVSMRIERDDGDLRKKIARDSVESLIYKSGGSSLTGSQSSLSSYKSPTLDRVVRKLTIQSIRLDAQSKESVVSQSPSENHTSDEESQYVGPKSSRRVSNMLTVGLTQLVTDIFRDLSAEETPHYVEDKTNEPLVTSASLKTSPSQREISPDPYSSAQSVTSSGKAKKTNQCSTEEIGQTSMKQLLRIPDRSRQGSDLRITEITADDFDESSQNLNLNQINRVSTQVTLREKAKQEHTHNELESTQSDDAATHSESSLDIPRQEPILMKSHLLEEFSEITGQESVFTALKEFKSFGAEVFAQLDKLAERNKKLTYELEMATIAAKGPSAAPFVTLTRPSNGSIIVPPPKPNPGRSGLSLSPKTHKRRPSSPLAKLSNSFADEDVKQRLLVILLVFDKWGTKITQREMVQRESSDSSNYYYF
ncbi:hypothetical protein BCR33DRAFT_767332 [Rhizoclosmatium globosum]|uniref:Uncharacterized protein n=1 Tax=Rhizoclosmatium globosum TaxID=329046 RepID=A0A1Y2C532_9FUNG|nr:hypothetical protein BCR33DRAFT_767332 [Rhizoclosmatium globosum]|eukprot:ORY41987.1 hypothetical protein BCR33DRAFT_767332 [Rhizoclosmatium globosum]